MKSSSLLWRNRQLYNANITQLLFISFSQGFVTRQGNNGRATDGLFPAFFFKPQAVVFYSTSNWAELEYNAPLDCAGIAGNKQNKHMRGESMLSLVCTAAGCSPRQKQLFLSFLLLQRTSCLSCYNSNHFFLLMPTNLSQFHTIKTSCSNITGWYVIET